MSYKKSNWVPYDPALSFEQNVTQGGTTTADKLNNMETGISNAFDKTSDTIGGRNLLPGTSGTLQTVTNASDWVTNLPEITPVVATIDSDTTYTARAWISPASHDTNLQIVWQDSSGATFYRGGNNVSAGTSGYSTWTGTITAGSTIQHVAIVFGAQQSTPSSVSYKEMKLEQGSIATDWTPAPEDKVNVSDMRKPASDVAGIEEVSTLQTQVNNSAVGTNLLTGTSSDLKTKQLTNVYNAGPQATNGSFEIKVVKGQTYTYRAWIDNTNGSDDAFVNIRLFPIGALSDSNLANGSVIGKGETGYSTLLITLPEDGYINLTPVAYGGPETALVRWKEEKFEKGSVATDWCPNPEDKVNVSDMRKPANDVAGIEEVNAKQDKLTITPADDSKVAHLSGANNFDTVPTVDNKSLATTDDVTTASNTVLTSANTSISKLLQSSSNNDEDSAVTNSTSDTSNFYYWTE